MTVSYFRWSLYPFVDVSIVRPVIFFCRSVDFLSPLWSVSLSSWHAYRPTQPKLGLQHETVNHSVHFVDPCTGVHTQSIESYWAKTKYKFKVMKGVAADSLPSYLDERMWRDRWGATKKDAFESICNHIAEQYPV